MDIQFMIIGYVLAINLFSFILMGIDKRRAKKQSWRIPEKTLWLTAVCGGSIGSITGMRTFRHKTKHKMFTVGMPIIFLLQIIATFIVLRVS